MGDAFRAAMTAGERAEGRSRERTGFGGVGELMATVTASQRGSDSGVEALRIGVEVGSRWPRPGIERLKWHGIFWAAVSRRVEE